MDTTAQAVLAFLVGLLLFLALRFSHIRLAQLPA
jgi:hypothetical protein